MHKPSQTKLRGRFELGFPECSVGNLLIGNMFVFARIVNVPCVAFGRKDKK
jgi:hypothetical protein